VCCLPENLKVFSVASQVDVQFHGAYSVFNAIDVNQLTCHEAHIGICADG
jgi:hypothetical protein